ncbi:MAG: glycosyltransferase family 4 protein [Vulcanimicrobiaceae bacterium]
MERFSSMLSGSETSALFLGSFPPRECGIATFTKDVVDSYNLAFGATADVIAIDEPGGETRDYPREVVARLSRNDRASYRRVAQFINAHPSPLLNVQHEYGLFGGVDGEWFLDLLDAIDKPVVVSLHTVLPEPTSDHRLIARTICDRATAIVVLSQTGKDILVATYGVDEAKIRVIHHGVPDVPFAGTEIAKIAAGLGDRPIVSTFGLISRGKGLEYAIEAMHTVVKRHPTARYVILGGTHPEVRRREGESYRESLVAKVDELGLRSNVVLVDHYLPFDELISYLSATDIYLTPYLNPAQIVSGTLAYAVGCGKAIVSTPYLYARELLAHERGLLAGFRDAAGLARAIGALLDDPSRRRAIERRAYRFGRQMTWPRVADAYGRLFTELTPRLFESRLMLPA